MSEEKMNTDDMHFWAINVGHDEGIPAVEQDLTNGQFNVLIFTSKEAAQKYCYLRAPGHLNNVYQLDRRRENGKTTQLGLMRMARRCLLRYKHIAGVIFDHPGVIGPEVRYATMEDVLSSARKPLSRENVMDPKLIDYLSKADADDDL